MVPRPVNSNAKALKMKQITVGMLLTYGGLAFGAGLVAIMAWLERRPRKTLTPRMVPTTPLMFLGAFICLIAVIHIVNSYGIQTGRRFSL
jgi:hypothetical protein